ncbi:protein of unknown function [Methanoculleus bourgensis]|uniref:Uncharacterized protein n=1 Tax=Methanoculleus bourgensis TaxID=83986 RepID=A0A0X3BN93_9EURY|nr:protein of unknown function [Methanoculleus bourgensis]
MPASRRTNLIAIESPGGHRTRRYAPDRSEKKIVNYYYLNTSVLSNANHAPDTLCCIDHRAAPARRDGRCGTHAP